MPKRPHPLCQFTRGSEIHLDGIVQHKCFLYICIIGIREELEMSLMHSLFEDAEDVAVKIIISQLE